MTRSDLTTIAEVLNLLPFVTWDRFTEIPEGDADVYGWIDRDDGRADYVQITFPAPITPGYYGFSTSSAKHSAEISKILFGESGEHYECQRVDEHFGDLVENKVVLT